MVMQPLKVQLKDVCVRRRGKTILGPVSVDLGAAGMTMVIGPNGAGKTTLLKVLHGVERVSGGQVIWSQNDTDVRQAQAFIFQSPIMLRRSVRQNLAYPLQLLKRPRRQIDEEVVEWSKRIDLFEALDQPAPRLSGGERQKLALGRALIRNPKVLFLDEPCANLDGGSTREIEGLLRQAAAAGTRIIMTTHNMGQAQRLADDVVFMVNGSIEEHRPAAAFFKGSVSPTATAFLKGEIIE
ncbi:ATP-binding cassette domain-containing protein [Algirhabdus cladophorae]|uniref:ATP-binding cassette domain-containing protein n=1 Tax=Algirhabdus cladophorae TaxID=3377108 RepID=UPI003B847AB7